MEAPGKVLVLGSGAIKIAEAAEFDYSGSQALKALREEGIETVLVNPNVATIQTSSRIADRVYLGPLTGWYVERVIERERPDAVMIGFGGQTALSLGVRLHDSGVLDRYSVKVLGTPIEGVKRALSRRLFREAMREAGVPIPPSTPVNSVEEALEAAESIGYPVIARVSFNLGGGGSFIAWGREELERWIARALAQSETREVLVEKYLYHWKEIEYEVVRDSRGNMAAVACLENLDPMGVHTGDSFVVAPCQTLSDYEYQLLRRASFIVASTIWMVGEGNVQLAQNPEVRGEYYVIEVNPRMSRSSALASKATGYPLAYIAAKLALGYGLDEIINSITGRTCACFEPSLDYVVIKAPRWDLDKFEGAIQSLDSEMKSIGEAMAIGRGLAEALQKSVRMIAIGEEGLTGRYYLENEPLEAVMERLRERRPYWPLHAAKALRLGASIEELYRVTGVDKFFLLQIKRIVEVAEELRRHGLREDLLAEAKRLGFSDEQISLLTGVSRGEVEETRLSIGSVARSKLIDTLAGEWDAVSNYRYLTHSAFEDDEWDMGKRRILVLGAGVFRIGVSVEFDWGVVSYSDEARKLGYTPIILNYNPETVSTDWDVSGNLLFDEISVEAVKEAVRITRPLGVVAFLGGQLSNNIAGQLEREGVTLIGTPGRSVDVAEDRARIHELLEDAGVEQPPWVEASSLGEALHFAETVGYPVIVRPSYVLSGTSIRIVRGPEELRSAYMAAARSSRASVVVSKLIDGVEIDLDAVGDGSMWIGALIEHIEPPGVHSGDSTMVLPHYSLGDDETKAVARVADAVNSELEVRGPFNIQLIASQGRVYLIEVNLRASRSMPFTSKITGYNLMKAAAEASLTGSIRGLGDSTLLKPNAWGVKSPQFSWSRIKGAYPGLGPEMRSTGEVAALGWSLWEALLKSWLSVHGNRLPESGGVLVYTPTGEGREDLATAGETLARAGYNVYTLEDMEAWGTPLSHGEAVELIRRGVIGLVATTSYAPKADHKIRRIAADLGASLILNHRLARMLAEALSRVDVSSMSVATLDEYTRRVEEAWRYS
ncbi:MAG: carbamoyl-phosphate synthase (glutamine-hydrolyzing) large subunit [Desulfurococcales archaeon]|nr:carbamoyl-phosphate synthase (glutamine-hydrolyzing) large subunit [Desulfurococcales archaeon]MCE4605445.1 carbamoyl-phosphate synthase (glutamine-hydrolyzing) large subunit [Desulfurococcales archaeon]